MLKVAGKAVLLIAVLGVTKAAFAAGATELAIGTERGPAATQRPGEPPPRAGLSGSAGSGGPTDSAVQPQKNNLSEDEDFSGTPFTEYGEFNDGVEEENTLKFLRSGRLFGVSIGLGSQFVDGNRGSLWQGGFPVFDFKFHYWFNFNFAVDVGFSTANNYYDTTIQNIGHINVNLLRLGTDIKYYFNTANLSSAITFANPYLLFGAGSFTKTETGASLANPDTDTSLGLCFGGGLEFVISPKKTYFEIEAKMNVITFQDTSTTRFLTVGLENLTGNFYTITGNVLLTW